MKLFGKLSPAAGSPVSAKIFLSKSHRIVDLVFLTSSGILRRDKAAERIAMKLSFLAAAGHGLKA
jgi:hypothetical protein